MGGALAAGMTMVIMRMQLHSLHTPMSHPFSLQMSRYGFFLLSFGTGATFSCRWISRSFSRLHGERIP